MEFETPLVPGRLVRRWNRFLAEVTLETGETVRAHCPNPGSMIGLGGELINRIPLVSAT